MKSLLYFILIVFIFGGGYAQENNSQRVNLWVRIENTERDFSIALPQNFIFYKEKSLYLIKGSDGEDSFHVSMEENSNAVKEFQNALKNLKNRENYQLFKSGDFVGMQYKGENYDNDYFYISLTLASPKGRYTVSATSKELSDKDYERFLQSIRLNGKPLFKQDSSTNVIEEKTISVSALQTDAAVLNALRQKDSNQDKLLKVPEEKMNEKDTNVYSRGLIILKKPRPSYTDSARQEGIQGTVKLRITYLASGQLGSIYLISSPGRGLDKEAFRAAKKIKFIPAEINGKPVDVTRTVEYHFSIY